VTSLRSLEAFFIYHKPNRRILTNRVRQQVIQKRRIPLTTLRINLSNHRGYNLCIPLFDLQISAVILLSNVRFKVP